MLCVTIVHFCNCNWFSFHHSESSPWPSCSPPPNHDVPSQLPPCHFQNGQHPYWYANNLATQTTNFVIYSVEIIGTNTGNAMAIYRAIIRNISPSSTAMDAPFVPSANSWNIPSLCLLEILPLFQTCCSTRTTLTKRTKQQQQWQQGQWQWIWWHTMGRSLKIWLPVMEGEEDKTKISMCTCSLTLSVQKYPLCC